MIKLLLLFAAERQKTPKWLKSVICAGAKRMHLKSEKKNLDPVVALEVDVDKAYSPHFVFNQRFPH